MIRLKNNCVYIHIFPNGKVYIGQTSQTTAQRWIRGKGYKGQLVERAIKKYGWDNIEHKVLYSGLTEEEANEIEIRLISEYNSTNEDFGYNLLDGGKSKGQNLQHSKDHYKKVSEINRKAVDCYKRDGTWVAAFESVNSAADFVKGGFRVISACCNGKKKSAYGYIWRFKGDAFEKYDTHNNISGVKGNPVDVYSIDGEFLGTYKTQKSAAQCLGISEEKVSLICRGMIENTNGIVFRLRGEDQ